MTGGSLWPLALADPVGVSVAFHACDTGGSRGAFRAQAAHDLRSFPPRQRELTTLHFVVTPGSPLRISGPSTMHLSAWYTCL